MFTPAAGHAGKKGQKQRWDPGWSPPTPQPVLGPQGPGPRAPRAAVCVCDMGGVGPAGPTPGGAGGGRQPRVREQEARGLEGVNSVSGLSDSEAPQAAVEIPCARRVVTQKRETMLFGAGDGGGWRPGAEACHGAGGWQGFCCPRGPDFQRCSGLVQEDGRLAGAGHATRCPWALTGG